MRRLRVTQLDALLLHRPLDLMGKHGFVYSATLSALKTRGLIRAAGISVYAPEELDMLWSVFLPDLVQIPFSVFDRRLIHSGWLSRLRQAGIRIHTRSSFLQGLLLMDKANRPAYFQPWAGMLDRWQTWCVENRLTFTQSALNFVLAQEGIERVIIGVDSVSQLDEILLSASGQTAPLIFDSYTDDVNLLEPSRWKLP
jgi:aryl-alcohol dehydrogenase-like predicted oxidoreductase